MAHKTVRNVLISVVLGGGTCAFGAVATAQAATLYDHINYGDEMGSWGSGDLPSWANDRASSIKKGASRMMCENKGCTGRTAPLDSDKNDLRSFTVNLHIGESWSDRISALR